MSYQSITEPPGGGKFCRRCASIRALGEFSPNPYSTDGLAGWCRDCTATYQRERRARIRAARKTTA